jgi:16S rRNA processing protein RimM
MTREDCVLLGTISKWHGIRGGLIIRIKNLSLEPDENWESLFLQIDGILVPFFISSIFVFKADEWVVLFEDYDTRTSVEKLLGAPVWIRKDLVELDDAVLYMDELTGFELINTTTGKRGLIIDFMDIPGNPIFKVEATGEKIMVPAQDELIQQIDQDKKKLTMRLPEGIM